MMNPMENQKKVDVFADVMFPNSNSKDVNNTQKVSTANGYTSFEGSFFISFSDWDKKESSPRHFDMKCLKLLRKLQLQCLGSV